MSYLIAVCGKGGVGKSTLSASLVRLFLERGVRPVLAVDADPNNTLSPLLNLPEVPTVSDIREEVLKEKSIISGVPKERLLQAKLEECLVEASGFDLLTMGRPEGPTCYCYVNNLLRTALTSIRKNYPVIVVDNEAGMEHLSRMNTDDIDCMLFVSEPTVPSAQAVARIVQLCEGLPVVVRRKVLVWNKVKETGVPPAAAACLSNNGFDEVVYLPADPRIEQVAACGTSVLDVQMPDAFTSLMTACDGHLRGAALERVNV